MNEERELAETAVAADLFGAEGLAEEDAPPAPDKYLIVRLLGRGGGGAVYLARDTSLGRPVALKYLTHARPAEVERFFREARFVARLHDPAIVQIYEAGDVEGLPYIAMQYVAGGNLAAATLDAPSVVRVMRQVAGALAHAHGAGIVHRDIKPGNILLDEQRRAYVTDFGIARDLRGELGSTISQDGQILGTPGLMAPEQARGDVHAVDARSDIYALGATLYLKITGHEPFRADNLVDLLHGVIHDDPPFPRAYKADIPRDLEAIILRCMRKERDDRYPSMGEVIEAFDRHLAGERGGGLSPAWFTSYVRSKVEDAPAAPEPDSADHEWLPALDVAREIAAWDTQLYRVRGDLVRHFPRLDGVIERLTRALEDEPASGWARFYRGVAWFRRGELRRALEDMERSIDRVRDLAGAYFELGRLYLAIYLEEHQEAHKHLSRVGIDDHLRGARSRLEQAGIAFAEARRLKQELPGWQLRYAHAVNRLAEADFDGCVSLCDAILADDPDLDEVWKLKGDALRWAGQDPLPAYERALEIRRSYYEALLAVAEVHLEAGTWQAARSALERTLEIHSGLGPAQVLLARTYLHEARAAGSPELLRAGLDRATDAWEQHPDRYDAALTLAEFLTEMGRRAREAEWITRALETLERASRLEGCPNRVSYLQARARLERARLNLAPEKDPENARGDLEAILSLRGHEAARVPDNAPWTMLFEEAEQLAKLPASERG